MTQPLYRFKTSRVPHSSGTPEGWGKDFRVQFVPHHERQGPPIFVIESLRIDAKNETQTMPDIWHKKVVTKKTH